MVASAKLHKAQVAIGGKLPYEQKLHHILSGLLQDDALQKAMHDRLGFGNPDGHSAVVLQDVGLDQIPTKDIYPRIAIVAISSNSSLCGAFNANVIKKYQETISILEGQGYAKEDVDVYVIGRKMADAVRKSGYAVKADLSEMADKPSYDGVRLCPCLGGQLHMWRSLTGCAGVQPFRFTSLSACHTRKLPSSSTS